MPTIDIQRDHALGIEQARAVVDGIAQRMVEKFGMHTAWDGDTLVFRYSGIQGTIQVTDHDLRMQARLGLLLSPLKSRIEDEVRGKLDQYLG